MNPVRRNGETFFEPPKIVITSYSIHYTKLYDFSQLAIRVGRVARQILTVRGQNYLLDELEKPGECLILSLSH